MSTLPLGELAGAVAIKVASVPKVVSAQKGVVGLLVASVPGGRSPEDYTIKLFEIKGSLAGLRRNLGRGAFLTMRAVSRARGVL